MAKKKAKPLDANYLERIPVRADLRWETDEDGRVTLFVHNKGAMKKLTQLLLGKPEYTQVHLDETGSFVWPLIDGQKTIMDIAQEVDAHFGEKAHPLYERLVKFFQILESYRFVKLH